jgi:hypothetical protein
MATNSKSKKMRIPERFEESKDTQQMDSMELIAKDGYLEEGAREEEEDFMEAPKLMAMDQGISSVPPIPPSSSARMALPNVTLPSF